MPWPEKQRRAIFLDIMRRKGRAAAIRFMHEHGYGGKKKRKRDHAGEVRALAREVKKA